MKRSGITGMRARLLVHVMQWGRVFLYLSLPLRSACPGSQGMIAGRQKARCEMGVPAGTKMRGYVQDFAGKRPNRAKTRLENIIAREPGRWE